MKLEINLGTLGAVWENSPRTGCQSSREGGVMVECGTELWLNLCIVSHVLFEGLLRVAKLLPALTGMSGVSRRKDTDYREGHSGKISVRNYTIYSSLLLSDPGVVSRSTMMLIRIKWLLKILKCYYISTMKMKER